MSDGDAWERRLQIEREAGHGRDEPGQCDEPRRAWPACAEPECVRHHRALREPAEDGPLGRDARVRGDVVEPATTRVAYVFVNVSGSG